MMMIMMFMIMASHKSYHAAPSPCPRPDFLSSLRFLLQFTKPSNPPSSRG
jgi:hypothetical protein